MKLMCYEYEWGEVTYSNLQNGPSQKPSAYPTAAIVCETKHYLVTLHSYDH
jgi:hypothetical protein